jgi:hypothetical protein
MHTRLVTSTAVALAAVAFSSVRAEPLQAPPPPDAQAALRAADLDTLKRWYLACDHASRRAPLDAPTGQACSLTAEVLMQRGFGGDFDRLIAWWQGARDKAFAQAAR